ncbi:MAG: SMP-30/gluconolactonase/LRE family protein [Chitinophagaceae bacterium]|nr:SMP-30/gluconolactonase/LRE family protein [Chitinophagaceae bacterium]
MPKFFLLITLFFMLSCNNEPGSKTRTLGSIERTDPSIDKLISTDAVIEIIADGHDWTEGPVWIESEKMLLYSDIPPNKIFKWTEAKGKELYLTPSGYTGTVPRGGEPGSNGLILNKEGKLVLCQHGDRRMALMDAELNAPAAKFISLADNYMGKKLNSPNDAVYRSNGDLFFTDPPYGLANDSLKEISFQGVYKVANGQVVLMTDTITRPNGIAFLNNEKTLVVANSDPDKAIWYLYDFGPNDSLVNQRMLADVTELGKKGEKGLPDGLKVDKQGNIFATGPGGVFVFNAEGKQIGRFKIPEACSNVALADDDRTLYITADMYVLRVKLRKQ